MSTLSLLKDRFLGELLRTLRRLENRLETLRRRLAPGPVTLFRDVTATWLASALCLAARLRLADRLGEETLTVEELSRRSNVPTGDLQRLLRVLDAHGYFRLGPNLHVTQTHLSRALRRDVAGSFAELQGRGWYRQAFLSSKVLQGWEEGRTPFEVAQGAHFFDHLHHDEEARTLFLGAMADVTRFCTPYLALALTLRPGESFLDVGGGDGELARALAGRYPKNATAVMDRGLVETSHGNSATNYQFHQGDFFEIVTPGYDHLCLKNILHDWDDERSVEILQNCRQAVQAGARLTVIECTLPESGEDRSTHADTYALDWNVWLTLSGRERSVSGYRDLLERSGWSLVEVKPTATPYSLFEAVAR